jgi:hypothetical protein
MFTSESIGRHEKQRIKIIKIISVEQFLFLHNGCKNPNDFLAHLRLQQKNVNLFFDEY